MFDTICTIPLTSDLFAQAIHPTLPILSVGLAVGHVQTYRLPSRPNSEDEDEDAAASENGFGQIESVWRTRRHKGSCRCLAFAGDGEKLFSAGTDGLVKVARVETGVVEDKIAIPEVDRSTDRPTILHPLTPQTLLLATDSSALYLYDLRSPSPSSSSSTTISTKPQETHRPHDDYISSLTPLPASDTSTSGYSKQFVTTGGTTLAVTDLRRGVLVRSEDQEEELLSSVFVSGLKKGGSSKGEKVLVGSAGGVLTLWERGVWDDQDERITVERGGEAVESMAVVPDALGKGKMIAVGLGDGRVRFVRLGANKIVGECRHDDLEGVVGLGFDTQERMVSGGGSVVKVWHEGVGGEEDHDGGVGLVNGLGKRGLGSGDEDSDEDEGKDEESSEEEDKIKKKRKKRKRNKGKDRSGGQHVMAFKGLD